MRSGGLAPHRHDPRRQGAIDNIVVHGSVDGREGAEDIKAEEGEGAEDIKAAKLKL